MPQFCAIPRAYIRGCLGARAYLLLVHGLVENGMKTAVSEVRWRGLRVIYILIVRCGCLDFSTVDGLNEGDLLQSISILHKLGPHRDFRCGFF